MKYEEDKDKLDAGYSALANAIVIQAVKDYRKAIRHFDLFTMGQIRYFFHSQWFQMLTSIDGDRLIKDIERRELYEKQHVRNAIKKCNQTENRKNK